MMHKAWSSIEEVPYCFSRSYVKFQGHTALKIVEFDPNWAFPDCNSSLNSPMAMKCCTKLETAKERCPIVFQGHPSNFKVTRDKTSSILTQIGCFRTIGRSQLSNPSDLPCFKFVTLTLSCVDWCESLVWVIMGHGAAGGISECRRSSCSSYYRSFMGSVWPNGRCVPGVCFGTSASLPWGKAGTGGSQNSQGDWTAVTRGERDILKPWNEITVGDC